MPIHPHSAHGLTLNKETVAARMANGAHDAGSLSPSTVGSEWPPFSLKRFPQTD